MSDILLQLSRRRLTHEYSKNLWRRPTSAAHEFWKTLGVGWPMTDVSHGRSMAATPSRLPALLPLPAGAKGPKRWPVILLMNALQACFMQSPYFWVWEMYVLISLFGCRILHFYLIPWLTDQITDCIIYFVWYQAKLPSKLLCRICTSYCFILPNSRACYVYSLESEATMRASHASDSFKIFTKGYSEHWPITQPSQSCLSPLSCLLWWPLLGGRYEIRDISVDLLEVCPKSTKWHYNNPFSRFHNGWTPQNSVRQRK